MARTKQKQRLFTGRDYSWMQFNRRVLEEAEDPTNPLLERVKFLAITASNLDEYVEIQYRCWNHLLLPELRNRGIRLLQWNELDSDQRAYAQGYFQRDVDPL